MTLWRGTTSSGFSRLTHSATNNPICTPSLLSFLFISPSPIPLSISISISLSISTELRLAPELSMSWRGYYTHTYDKHICSQCKNEKKRKNKEIKTTDLVVLTHKIGYSEPIVRAAIWSHGWDMDICSHWIPRGV